MLVWKGTYCKRSTLKDGQGRKICYHVFVGGCIAGIAMDCLIESVYLCMSCSSLVVSKKKQLVGYGGYGLLWVPISAGCLSQESCIDWSVAYIKLPSLSHPEPLKQSWGSLQQLLLTTCNRDQLRESLISNIDAINTGWIQKQHLGHLEFWKFQTFTFFLLESFSKKDSVGSLIVDCEKTVFHWLRKHSHKRPHSTINVLFDCNICWLRTCCRIPVYLQAFTLRCTRL